MQKDIQIVALMARERARVLRAKAQHLAYPVNTILLALADAEDAAAAIALEHSA